MWHLDMCLFSIKYWWMTNGLTTSKDLLSQCRLTFGLVQSDNLVMYKFLGFGLFWVKNNEGVVLVFLPGKMNDLILAHCGWMCSMIMMFNCTNWDKWTSERVEKELYHHLLTFFFAKLTLFFFGSSWIVSGLFVVFPVAPGSELSVRF